MLAEYQNRWGRMNVRIPLPHLNGPAKRLMFYTTILFTVRAVTLIPPSTMLNWPNPMDTLCWNGHALHITVPNTHTHTHAHRQKAAENWNCCSNIIFFVVMVMMLTLWPLHDSYFVTFAQCILIMASGAVNGSHCDCAYRCDQTEN